MTFKQLENDKREAPKNEKNQISKSEGFDWTVCEFNRFESSVFSYFAENCCINSDLYNIPLPQTVIHALKGTSLNSTLLYLLTFSATQLYCLFPNDQHHNTYHVLKKLPTSAVRNRLDGIIISGITTLHSPTLVPSPPTKADM